jgi:nitrogen regulatory protein PII
MYVLFIVLNKTDFLDDVLASLMKSGVRGATIIDSKGMAGAMVHGQMPSFPLFGSLKSIIEGAHPYNNTIFSVVDNDELLNKAIAGVQQVLGKIPHPGAGFMFNVPVSGIYKLGEKVK